jgi:hypothetical protein
MRSTLGFLALAVVSLASACHREDGSGNDDDMGAGSDMPSVLTIQPLNPTIVVNAGMAPPTQPFQALLDGTPVAATWATDRGELGSIDSAGVYTPTGALGGKALVQASYMGLMATTNVTVQYVLTENGDPKCGMAGTIGAGGYGGVGGNGPGCVADPTQVTNLGGAPTADATVKWLYPYDATVFPRGLLAPLMMWNPGAHDFDALSLHMESKGGTFIYDGTFSKPTGKPFINMPIPQATWTAMNYSSSGDDVTITVKLAQGTTVIGPITNTWRIAAGTLKGIVYYNSYGTSLVTNSEEDDKAVPASHFGAGTLGIRPGETDPVLIAGKNSADGAGCRVCHSVAKDGSLLITQKSANGDQDSVTVDLKMGNIEAALTPGNSAFPAIFPDSTKFFTSSGGMRNGDAGGKSQLYSLPSGAVVASPPGLPADLQAALPSFAPDGSMVAFNHYGGTGSDKKSLAVMTFDSTTNTFGAVTHIHTPAMDYPAVWPSFMPTNKAIVFETETKTNEWAYTRSGNLGELWWVDVASKSAHALDKLNGVGYLPTGALHDDDVHLNYEPTVNPVPSGGYAWVVFTSRRLYGNVATQDPFLSDPRAYNWKVNMTTKKLWVAAIDINGMPGTDPSHPAFYLPAQELAAGNSRGFWTVGPCVADGGPCNTGDECCGGYCQPVTAPDGATGYTCSSNKPMCAMEFEKCVTDADCCQPTGGSIDPGMSTMPSLSCINGYCSADSPPIL